MHRPRVEPSNCANVTSWLLADTPADPARKMTITTPFSPTGTVVVDVTSETPLRLMVSDHNQLKGAPPLMLTREDDIDVQALRRQGWTISAMARRTCNQRPSLSCMTADLLPDPATGFGERVRQRLRDEQVIWFTTVGG